MLSAAVEAGVDDKAIGLQANWKDPGPLVLKYARKRKDISVGMVRNLAAQLREQWKPDPEEFTVEDRDDIVEPVVIEYVLKNNASAAKITAADVKFHIFHPAHNPNTDFVWEAGDRRLLVFWSGASRRCVQDLPG